ncbi:MAG: hypothetical protein AAGL66_15315, partial [Pseudomonadota bacterium]
MMFAVHRRPCFTLPRRLKLSVAVFFMANLGVAPAGAHETWLLPSSEEIEPGKTVDFAITSGMGFPALASGIDANRVVDTALIQGTQRRDLVPVNAFEDALELRAVPGPGLACSWVQLRPRILEIPERDSVEHYLEEIGAGDEVY